MDREESSEDAKDAKSTIKLTEANKEKRGILASRIINLKRYWRHEIYRYRRINDIHEVDTHKGFEEEYGEF